MSTSALFIFDDRQQTICVYKQHDGYPEGHTGAIAAIAKALPFAWPLPRFEADEFAAAFVAANKTGAGGIFICNRFDECAADHTYKVTCRAPMYVGPINHNTPRILVEIDDEPPETLSQLMVPWAIGQ